MGGGIEGELKTNRLLLLPVLKFNKDNDLHKQLKEIANNEDKISRINNLVYKIYALKNEEIKYIETQQFFM